MTNSREQTRMYRIAMIRDAIERTYSQGGKIHKERMIIHLKAKWGTTSRAVNDYISVACEQLGYITHDFHLVKIKKSDQQKELEFDFPK